MFSLYNRITTTVLLSLLLSGMACLTGTPSVWGQASTPLSPEEVAGQSLKEINGLHYMSQDFATSPDGKPVPKSQDDQWVPDMSLTKPTETKNAGKQGQTTGSLPQKNVKNPQTLPSNMVPAGTSNPIAVAQSVPTTSPFPQTGSVKPAVGIATTPSIQQTGYDPGFRIGADKQNIVIPPVATTSSIPQSTQVATSTPAPQKSTDTNWSDAGFASSKQYATPVPVTLPQSTTPRNVYPQVQANSNPGNHIQNNTVVPQPPIVPAGAQSSAVAPKATGIQPSASNGWSDSFSQPGQNAKPVDMVLSSQEASKMNLSDLTINDIRVSGLEMSTQRFNKLIKTKIGNKFSQQTLEEDKRTLLQTKQFIDVTVSTTLIPEKPDSITVNFDLTPRRLVQYIKVIGNRKISKTNILEEIGMKRGETRLDPYDVENGRLRIVELYKNKGYNEPHVDILRGDRPEDIGVVYSIDEGVKQRVLKTEFVGNKIASSARLKSLIISKPGFLYVIGGDFSRERLDEDVTKLLEYYRRLGFFDARIDREFEEGEGYTGQGKPHAWVTVRYVIDEGPRYRVRNFLFEGNKVIPTEELDKLLKAKKNEYYDQSLIEEDRIAIKYAYQDRGYVLAEIDPKQILTDEEGYLDVRFEITEKDRYRVRDILVSYDGEARTKSSVILNMLDIAPGQLLNGRKIRASETSLRRSGYFNDKPNEGPLPTIKIIPEDEIPAPEKNDFKPRNKGNHNSSKKPAAGLGYNQSGTSEPIADYAYIRPVSEQTIRGQMRQIPTGFSNTTTSASAPQTTTYSNGNSVYIAPSAQPAQTMQGPVSSYGDTSMYSNASSAAVSPSGTTTPSNLNNGYTYSAPQGSNPGTTGYNAPTTSGIVNTTNSAVYGGTPSYGNPYASAASSAPPLSGDTMETTPSIGIPSGSMAAPQLAAAPGFAPGALAGRDVVFPGSIQQQQLSQELGPQMTAPSIKQADVVASIKEGRTGMFQASIGVNSDYGLVGNVSLTERNFDLFRLPTSFTRGDGWRDAFRGGGQIFQVQASPGTEIQRYSVSWDVPYIFNTKANFGISGLYAERSYTEWFESRIGSEVRLGYQWTPRFSTTLNGSYYNVKISDPMVSYVPDLNDVLGRNDMYTVGLSASYDTRNHPFLPSQGYVINGGAEMVMGDYKFPRLSLDARTYHTLHKRFDNSGRWILGLRSAAGWMDDAPIYERFYGGGSRTIRGFEYREVTPRFKSTTFGLGGNFEWYNSAEVLIPLSGGDEFQLALFVDTGTVASTIKDMGTYRVAPGFGFRVSIPMLGPAPLALDFSFPVSSDKDDVKQVFSFDMTGSR